MSVIRVLSLPRFEGSFENRIVIDPETGRFETHGDGHSISMGDYIVLTVFPSVRQLRKIRSDIDRYLAKYDTGEDE